MRKIALIGTGASGVEGPYDDESYEIWGVASRFPYVTRADRWFELHRMNGETQAWQDNWRKAMHNSGLGREVELLMFYPEPELGPKVAAYPYQRITARFGTYFMTSSFSWMLALAIDELRPKGGEPVPGELGIWGVDMEYGTEYRQQRAGFRHFVDLARVMGVAISRFADSGLSFEPVPYPLWQDDPLINKLEKRNRETIDKMKNFEETLLHTRSMIAQNEMAIGVLSKPLVKKERLARIASLEKELKGLLTTSAQISHDIVAHTAIESEQRWFRDYLSH